MHLHTFDIVAVQGTSPGLATSCSGKTDRIITGIKY